VQPPPTITGFYTIDSLLLHKFPRIAIVNGHAGNAGTVELVARRYRRSHGLVIPSIAPLQIIQAPDVIERVVLEPV